MTKIVSPSSCEFHYSGLRAPIVNFDKVWADEETCPVESVRAMDSDNLKISNLTISLVFTIKFPYKHFPKIRLISFATF